MTGDSNAAYADGRTALLDALSALEPLGLENVTVVGAQAVYLHNDRTVGRIPAQTGDADLITSYRVGGLVAGTVEMAGWVRRPGSRLKGMYHTSSTGITGELLKVDVLDPDDGLELAMLDRSLMTIESLRPADTRRFVANVAGPLALLVAKGHKLHDHYDYGEESFRDSAKDLADVYRLLQVSPIPTLQAACAKLPRTSGVSVVMHRGIRYLRELTATADAPGTQLLYRTLGQTQEARVIVTSLQVLVGELQSLVHEASA